MHDLSRFHLAQSNPESGYDLALSEIRRGYKTSCWIWYIFPQLRPLCQSTVSVYYGLEDLEEARAYASDPLLRHRLREITQVLVEHEESSIRILMGNPIDCKKLWSCMTLFEIADPDYDGYNAVMEKYYHGQRDFDTLRVLYPSSPER